MNPTRTTHRTIDIVEPPASLYQHVRLKLEETREIHKARRLFLIWIVALISSTIGTLIATRSVFIGLNHSSFFAFASLVFSDGEILLRHWKDYGYSLVESLPVISLTLLVGCGIIFLEAIRKLITSPKTLLWK